MPKDITELYASMNTPIIVGHSMTQPEVKTPEEIVRKHLEHRSKEIKELEDAGYDYNGQEAWLEAMSRVGRR